LSWAGEFAFLAGLLGSTDVVLSLYTSILLYISVEIFSDVIPSENKPPRSWLWNEDLG
jgi:hypothetical protein